jgi:integrase
MVHAHMLRHACGYALANKGHDTRALQAYLGRRSIQHTVRYTEHTIAPTTCDASPRKVWWFLPGDCLGILQFSRLKSCGWL